MKLTICTSALLFAMCVVVATAHATKPTGDASVVKKMPNLVAFWTFDEQAEEQRVSEGTTEALALQEVGGPIARVEGGPYSGHAAELNGKQYFRIPYAETGGLNICGPTAQVSMFAVVRIENLRQSRTIAGMWSEGKGRNDDSGTRQYSLLMNMPTYGGPRQLTPHISSEGGVTRRADGTPFPWCADYAATKREVPTDQWCSLGFTYDSRYIRAYINGVMDARELDPKRDRREDRYFTKEGPDGKTRGMNPYYHGRGIFAYDPERHAHTKPRGGSDFTVGSRYVTGSRLTEATIGRFGGLAVFNRALTDAEMKSLHDSARIDVLTAQCDAERPRNVVFKPPRHESSDELGTLKVITLNVAHGRSNGRHQALLGTKTIHDNLDRIAKALARESPDVVALQEADGPSVWSGKFNHVEYISKEADFAHRFRGEHVRGLRLSYGTAFLSRLPLNDCASITFPPSPPTFSKGFVIGSIGWPERKGVNVTVVSAHLDFARTEVRQAQVQHLIKRLKDVKDPLLVMGDFNCEWQGEEPSLRLLAEKLSLQAYQPAAKDLDTFPRSGRRLDWILTSPNLAFVSYANMKDTLSDHRGVMAVVRLAPQAEAGEGREAKAEDAQ